MKEEIRLKPDMSCRYNYVRTKDIMRLTKSGTGTWVIFEDDGLELTVPVKISEEEFNMASHSKYKPKYDTVTIRFQSHALFLENYHRDIQRKCFVCMEAGHLAANCPNRICFRCKKVGHLAKNCTEQNLEKQDKAISPTNE